MSKSGIVFLCGHYSPEEIRRILCDVTEQPQLLLGTKLDAYYFNGNYSPEDIIDSMNNQQSIVRLITRIRRPTRVSSDSEPVSDIEQKKDD